MELHYALAQIADIRRQMTASRQFRGFRAGTALTTAAAASGAAVWQWLWPPDPPAFISLWVAIATASVVLCGIELAWRYCDSESDSQRELTRSGVDQFLPFILVGGLVTLILWEHDWQAMWMLPGLWQILFGLGIYSIRKMFPGPILFVGLFYMLCGLVNLTGSVAHFSVWSMALPFIVGQSVTAVILYWYLERPHAQE